MSLSLAPILRVFQALIHPPKSAQPEKSKDALKFGIIGAAHSAGWTLNIPAKLHSEVVVYAVAARDKSRAEAFAKKNNIPKVLDSYQALLDDPEIDCILVPLPNVYHFEWAVKAIKAGKHVLLEKPSTSNAIEAQALFTMPEFDRPNAPVMLEACHFRFHPVWSLFLSKITPADVVHVDTWSMIPWWFVTKDHIHFNYNLAGGTMMGMGAYSWQALRMIFDCEPEECTSADVKNFTEGVHHDCDYEFKTTWRFPGGRTGEAFSTLQGPTYWTPSYARVTHKTVPVDDKTLPVDQEKFVTKEVTLHGWIHAIFYHRLDVKETFEIRSRSDGRVIKNWTQRSTQKAYTPHEAGGELASTLEGEEYWMSFRYQLEQFVNKVKGRDTQYWISREDSLKTMQMMDMAYVKSGLGVRQSNKVAKELLESM